MWLFTTLSFRLADEVGEQDNKLENFVCHFAKLRGCQLLWSKVWSPVTKAAWDAKRWNPQESEEDKEEDVVVIDSETEQTP